DRRRDWVLSQPREHRDCRRRGAPDWLIGQDEQFRREWPSGAPAPQVFLRPRRDLLSPKQRRPAVVDDEMWRVSQSRQFEEARLRYPESRRHLGGRRSLLQSAKTGVAHLRILRVGDFHLFAR